MVGLGVASLAPGVLPNPTSGGTPWWGRGEMNLGAFPVGTVTFSANPITGSSIVLNGTTVGFVTSGAVGLQVNIGVSLATTLASLLALLSASSDTNLVQAVYSVVGSVLNVFSAGSLFVISASTSPASNAICVNGGP